MKHNQKGFVTRFSSKVDFRGCCVKRNYNIFSYYSTEIEVNIFVG